MRLSFSPCIVLLLAVAVVSISAASVDVTLRNAANNTGIYFGTILNMRQLSGPDRRAHSRLVRNHFNLITAENGCKFAATQPKQGVFDFSECDAIATFAQENKQRMRGHTLIWNNQNPDWLVNGDFSREELEAILVDHVKTVVGRYKGQFIAWDVVNEALLTRPTRKRLFNDGPWYPKVPNYVELAFQAAREADPDVKLFYNDFQAEASGAKADAQYVFLRYMKSRGVPIDGVGFQMHVSIDKPFKIEDVRGNIRRLAELGLVVHITEMDVLCPSPCTPDREALQKEMFSSVLRLCLEEVACESFQMWGISDKYTWKGTDNKPLLWDKYYRPKDHVQSMVDTLLNFKSEKLAEEEIEVGFDF
eukprot:Colp12_sorted_trinity150504_noHs@8259